jgi:hypothetical protein
MGGRGGSNAAATRKAILANERERTSAAGPAAISRNETNSTSAGRRPFPSLGRDDTRSKTVRSYSIADIWHTHRQVERGARDTGDHAAGTIEEVPRRLCRRRQGPVREIASAMKSTWAGG